jgi:hypothetical protein
VFIGVPNVLAGRLDVSSLKCIVETQNDLADWIVSFLAASV